MEYPYLSPLLCNKNSKTDKITGFEYPFVIKKPDSAFSKGVKKVANSQELTETLKNYFEETDIIIVQEFVPTEYDWRVGVLAGKVIYICKYFMARNHWQIVDWRKENSSRFGKTEAMPVDNASKKLLTLAIKATKLIGNGLYGVDIKEVDGKFYVIEVNDNPSIDQGVEDQIDKGKLYTGITDHLMHMVLTV